MRGGRGGAHVNPAVYKQGFLDRMRERVTKRVAGLRDGSLRPEEYRVPGATEWVRALRAQGVRCYLASGTDETDVRAEAALLGVDTLFDGIVGAAAEQTEGVKEALLQQLRESGSLNGAELVCFGDGPSELEATKALGGYAVGVAFDESKPFAADMRKRALLLRAGADLIVPCFSDGEALAKLLNL